MQSIAPAPTVSNPNPNMQNQNQNQDQDAGIVHFRAPSVSFPHSPRNEYDPIPSRAYMSLAPPITDLRAQLAAVIHPSHGLPLSHGYNEAQSNSASPHDHNIDPSIGAAQGGMMSTGGDSGGDDSLGDSRKGGKRELSQSKRAAQNRAAQRAFRQRKEGYIKKLEEQVRDLHALEDNYKEIQAQNYSLREYIIHLQSRLIESQGDYPQPPPNVNLPHPQQRHDPQHMEHHGAPVAPMAPMNPMQAASVAAARNMAVAGLNKTKHEQIDPQHPYDHSKRLKEGPSNDATDEEIIRSQLQASTANM